MKTVTRILAIGLLMMSSAAFAGPGDVGSVGLEKSDCVDAQGNDILMDADKFLPLIEKSKTCYEATKLAQACAFGATRDLDTVDSAQKVCLRELKHSRPGKADVALLKTMQARCDAHYDRNGGSISVSTTAYCNLSAVEFVVNLVSSVN